MEQYEKLYLYKRIVQAKLFIDLHYSERIDLNNIADQAHFSKFHFIRLFKSVYGYTPHLYLKKVQIDRAKVLLRTGNSVQQTSLSVGFESSTSFAAVFKKMVGKTPSEFQRAHDKKREAIRTNPLVAVPNCFAETYGWIK